MRSSILQMMTNAEKLATRPISELDVSAWPRCSTSYVQLPKDYPSLKCTGRTPEQASILNDIWVSVTSGSEDYSFKVCQSLPDTFLLTKRVSSTINLLTVAR